MPNVIMLIILNVLMLNVMLNFILVSVRMLIVVMLLVLMLQNEVADENQGILMKRDSSIQLTSSLFCKTERVNFQYLKQLIGTS